MKCHYKLDFPRLYKKDKTRSIDLCSVAYKFPKTLIIQMHRTTSNRTFMNLMDWMV